MDQMTRDTILTVATAVRYWAEGRTEGSYMEGDLNGMCAIASAELHKQLAATGISSRIYAWISGHDESAHVFLNVDDHVLDVTATQFSKMKAPDVYFAHERDSMVWPWFEVCQSFDTIDELVKWQKKNRWPGDQVAWK